MNERRPIIHMLARKLGVYLAAVAVAYVLAAITATQNVVVSLRSMNIEVGLAEQVSMMLRDLAGMAGMFLPLIAFGFLVAFLATALICHWWDRWRTPLYVLAGAVAIVAIHVALNLAFQITPVAIARSSSGLLIQAMAGAVGGYTYAALSQRSRRPAA